MRIIHWCDHYAPHIGGVEIAVGGVAEEFVRQGHEVLVITNHHRPALPPAEIIRGVSVHRFPVLQSVEKRDLIGLRRATLAIQELRQSFRPDVEHVHSTGPLLVAQQQVRRNLVVPAVCTLHCTHDMLVPLLAANSTATAFFRQARCILSPSVMLREAVAGVLPEVGPRLRLAPYGLRDISLRAEPLPYAPPVILCLGRVIREKGFDLALQALARLRPEFPAVRLVVAGDGVERPALEELAARLGLADAVSFLGWVPPEEVPALINRCTIMLVPSRWQEPFGLVVVEAARLSRPIVASAVGGMRASIEHGVTGLLFENENVEALANALRTLLATPDHARALGEKAREDTARRFGFARYFDVHCEMYREAIASPPASA